MPLNEAKDKRIALDFIRWKFRQGIRIYSSLNLRY